MTPVVYRSNSCKYYAIPHLSRIDPYLHREDGPAIKYSNGTKLWYQNNVRHRVDGPAVEYASGVKEWYINGKRHRVDGAAVIWTTGRFEWWLNGVCHRTDGPAIIDPYGNESWYYNGQRVECGSQEEFDRLIKLRALW